MNEIIKSNLISSEVNSNIQYLDRDLSNPAYIKDINVYQDAPGKAIFLEKNQIDVESNLAKQDCLPQGGTWQGERGNSTWKPNPDIKPDPENNKSGNPDNQTWGEILEEFDIEGIEFKNDDPDFSPISKAEVKVDNFTDDRSKNFPQADTKLAEQWTKEAKDGKTWTPRDIAEWRKENGYTWHECKDCKTMQLVPQKVHNNVPHSGGISEFKKQSTVKAE